MVSELQLDTRTIGLAHPVFVIAEIGVNHDGSLARALELVARQRPVSCWARRVAVRRRVVRVSLSGVRIRCLVLP